MYFPSSTALLLSITSTHQTHAGCCSSAASRLKNSQDTTAKHTSPARLPLVSRISTSIALRHIFRARPSPSHDHVPRARPTSTSEHVLRARLTAVAARRAFAEHVCGGVAWSGAPVGGRQPPPVTDRAPLSGAGAEQRPTRAERSRGPGRARCVPRSPACPPGGDEEAACVCDVYIKTSNIINWMVTWSQYRRCEDWVNG